MSFGARVIDRDRQIQKSSAMINITIFYSSAGNLSQVLTGWLPQFTALLLTQSKYFPVSPGKSVQNLVVLI
ncbi:MAG: hypothetical protein JGK24_23775 [Microcoleus sp. PH2017_29_MFU_D_A]|uniref:hypothetical protein n=1 Tax=unclassified Microcoleus TaxID=2642155 RepID=UPI001E0706B9|nr:MULTISPECIES: hypothetical protein [unclassified Microcoleus]MCC3606162.1 hypothetical protein [Microcoleus sp. PH2017_29_MFU_D_A]MCC3637194.1 hypothetical protein [Microcoleus sp. PH2017_37_MFU_D_B]